MSIKKEKGSVTLEAAISIIITMSVIITISFFMRAVYIHGLIQHALIQTANEMSVYSYIYSMSGLQEVNNLINNNGKAGSDGFSENLDSFVDFFDNISSGNFKDLSAPDVTDIGENAVDAAIYEVFNIIKTEGFNMLVKPLVKRHIPKRTDGQDYLLKYSVVNGLDGLDFSQSRYFEGSDTDSIHLVVGYRIKFVSPIKILDTLYIVQGAKARCWFKSSAPPKGKTGRGIWDEGDFDRGKEIIKSQGYANLPDKFKTFHGYKSGTKTAYVGISIDLVRDSYAGNPSAVKNKINSKISSMENYKKYSLNGVSLSADEIEQIIYYVYIPPDADPADADAAKKAAQDLSGMIELGNGKKVNLKIEVKVYG